MAQFKRDPASGPWPVRARTRTAQALIDHRSAVVDHFLADVQARGLVPEAVLPSERIDNVHVFLGELVAALEDEAASGGNAAREHGSQRLRVGVDLGTMIREYGVLIDCILEVLAEATASPTPAQDRVMRRFFMDAIASAATAYTREREAEIRDAREEVVAIVAHDVRTPLSVVDMNARAIGRLLEPGGDLDRDRIGKRLEGLTRASRRVNRLVEDLLDLSRVEAGRLPIAMASVGADALVDEALAHLAPLAEDSGIELRRGEVARVDTRCDHERVLQVFSNLVGNALKFTPRGGTVTLACAVEGDACTFSVSDTGPGIEAQHLAHVFDRYWQAPSAARRGAGLGLAIVKGIVEAHGGVVTVSSVEGEGSVFSFTLPLDAPPAP